MQLPTHEELDALSDVELEAKSFELFRQFVAEVASPAELKQRDDELDRDIGRIMSAARMLWVTHNSLTGSNQRAAHQFAERMHVVISSATDEALDG